MDIEINIWQICASLAVGYIIGELKEWNKKRKTKDKLKRNLMAMFSFNLERCAQMIDQMSTVKDGKIEIPNYPFDTDSIKNEISSGISLFKSKAEKEILDEINWRRYQLDHLNYKLPNLLMHPEAGALATHLHHLRLEKVAIPKLLEKLTKLS